MTRPNLILLVSRGHRWDASGFMGHPDARTPNLDAFAAQGAVFEQAFAPGPSPAMARTALWNGRSDPPVPGTSWLFRMLGLSGYETALIGSLGLAALRTHVGFAIARNIDEELPDPVYEDAALLEGFGGISNPRDASHSPITWAADHAVRYIQSAHTPFCLCVCFTKPAWPFDPPAPWDTRYAPDRIQLPDWAASGGALRVGPKGTTLEADEAHLRNAFAKYYGLVGQLDQQIGRIFATLSARGHTNNVIVYTSDTGEPLGQQGVIGNLDSPSDGVLRVPLVIGGVLRMNRGLRTRALATHADILPTLLSTTGLRAPKGLEGKSLAPVLRGEKQYVHQALRYQSADHRLRVIRTVRHKLIQDAEDDQPLFYDLETDPYEQQNLYGDAAHQATLLRLKRDLDRASGA